MPSVKVYFIVPVFIHHNWIESKLAYWTNTRGQVCDLKTNERGFNLMKSVVLIDAGYMPGEYTSDKWLAGTDPNDQSRYHVMSVILQFNLRNDVVLDSEQWRSFIEAFKARYDIIGYDDEGYNYAQYGCYHVYRFEYNN